MTSIKHPDMIMNTSNVTAKLFYNRQVYIAMIAEDIAKL